MLNPKNYPETAIDYSLNGVGGVQNIGFRYDLLDKNDIKIGELDGVSKGKVSYNEYRLIKRTASFSLNENGYRHVREINCLNDQIQPWFVLKMPDGGVVEWPLGIFLLEAPERNVVGNVRQRNIKAYDKSLILGQYRLTNRQYFPAGTVYTAAVEQLLGMAGLTKINVWPSPVKMAGDQEFPVGASSLEVINGLLDAINYTSLVMDEEGYGVSGPYIPPAKRPVSRTYSADRHSVITPGFLDGQDMGDLANVFILTANNIDGTGPIKSVYRNDDPRSPISTVSRGREVMDFRTVPEAVDQETLDARCKRIALENSQSYRRIKFSTILIPTHGANEILLLDIPNLLDVPSKFIETAWSMELWAGGLMSHEAKAAVDL